MDVRNAREAEREALLTEPLVKPARRGPLAGRRSAVEPSVERAAGPPLSRGLPPELDTAPPRLARGSRISPLPASISTRSPRRRPPPSAGRRPSPHLRRKSDECLFGSVAKSRRRRVGEELRIGVARWFNCAH